MVERNALFFYLDDYIEEFPEWYMDDLGHPSVQTAQRGVSAVGPVDLRFCGRYTYWISRGAARDTY